MSLPNLSEYPKICIDGEMFVLLPCYDGCYHVVPLDQPDIEGWWKQSDYPHISVGIDITEEPLEQSKIGIPIKRVPMKPLGELLTAQERAALDKL